MMAACSVGRHEHDRAVRRPVPVIVVRTDTALLPHGVPIQVPVTVVVAVVRLRDLVGSPPAAVVQIGAARIGMVRMRLDWAMRLSDGAGPRQGEDGRDDARLQCGFGVHVDSGLRTE